MTRSKEGPGISRNEGGYGLVSVVMAILLLSVGALSVSNVLTQSVAMQTVSSVRTAGLDVARAYMEDLKSRHPSEIASVASVRVNERGEEDPAGAYAVEVDVNEAEKKIKQVTVMVTTPRSSPVTLVTLIYDQTM